MDSIPTQSSVSLLLQKRLQQLQDNDSHPVALLVDKNAELLAGEGDLEYFGLDQLVSASDLAEQIPLLYQVQDMCGQTITFVQLPSGVIADISIAAQGEDFLVGLLVSTKQHIFLQKQQQKANELGLLQREQDITLQALREAYSQLEVQRNELDRTYSAQSHYLNTLSHEVRNPLQAILSTLDTTAPLSNEHRLRLRRGVWQLLGLVENLLVHGQQGQQVPVTKQQPVDIIQQVDDCVQLLRQTATDKSLYLHMVSHLPTSMQPIFQVDPYRLRQILFNLISNAIRYTECGGIQIEILVIDQDLHIRVVDTGAGMSEQDQAHLFTAYARGQNHAENTHGAGLGLTISRELASAMGGSLTVNSKLGVGSDFSLCLPLIVADQPNSSVEDIKTPDFSGQLSGQALIVDDDIDLREAFSEWLTGWGVNVRACKNLQELNSYLQNREAPDWLILDQQLPDGNSTEHLETLIEDWPKTRIVMLSGDDIEASLPGKVWPLRKPVDQYILFQALQME